MSRVHAIRTLEQLTDSEEAKPSHAPQPGVTIRIVNVAATPTQPAPIDITPTAPQIIDGSH